MEITTEIVSSVLGDPLGAQPACVCPTLDRFHVQLNNAHWSGIDARTKGLRRIAIAKLGTAGKLDERLFTQKLSTVVFTKLLSRVLRTVATILSEPHQSRFLEAAQRCESEGGVAAAEAAADAADAAEGDAKRSTVAAQLEPGGVAAAQFAAAAHSARAVWNVADVAGCLVVAQFAEWYGMAAQFAAAAAAHAAHAVWKVADSVRSAAPAADQLLSEFAEEVVQILVDMKTPGSAFLHLAQ